MMLQPLTTVDLSSHKLNLLVSYGAVIVGLPRLALFVRVRLGNDASMA